MALKDTDRTSVQRQKQQVTVDALIDAARRGMNEHGLDVTVDDIAALAEVGRRTVFRHFATREDLLQAALAAYNAEFMRSLPGYSGGDWLAWLADLARVAHQDAANAGRLVWDLRMRRLPPRLMASYTEHRQDLDNLLGTTATTLWQAAGGDGAAPQQLRQVVAAHLSPLFTQVILLDADGTPELAADMATDAITATVRQLLSS
ncbi:AcrR family transcriptional regulator [Nocardia sp. GAS34]|uniref:TetR/AcrR family transcriptional regulator n=1 Tax=unclassified Nocardia TaxID=2637762 RepID=UPI003D24008E